MKEDSGQDNLYQEMLGWPERDLLDELEIRVARLERLMRDLKNAERQQSPLVALIGIVVTGLLSVGSLILALLPFARIYQRGSESFGLFSEIAAILLAPVFFYGMYIAYLRFRLTMHKRQSIERFLAAATFTLAQAEGLNTDSHGGRRHVES